MKSQKEILVLGAGVSGLSTGILLLKRGYPVSIWAKELPPNTNSDQAAAVWYPYLCFPREKAIPWARITYEYFQKELILDPKSGCIIRPLVKLFSTPQGEPWWQAALPGAIEHPPQTKFPSGYVDAYRFQTIVIDTSIYMPYLVEQFKSLGGKIAQKRVSNITEAFAEHELVINCTALGSRELFKDQKIYPVRGQMIKIKKNAGFAEVVVDDDGPNCLAVAVTRIDDIVLGGTIQENNWDLNVNPADTEDILRKVRNIAPELEVGEIVSQSVGLRPVRESIRLEAEKFGDKTVIHNYGHGGAGFTLSWGCANGVVDLVSQQP